MLESKIDNLQKEKESFFENNRSLSLHMQDNSDIFQNDRPVLTVETVSEINNIKEGFRKLRDKCKILANRKPNLLDRSVISTNSSMVREEDPRLFNQEPHKSQKTLEFSIVHSTKKKEEPVKKNGNFSKFISKPTSPNRKDFLNDSMRKLSEVKSRLIKKEYEGESSENEPDNEECIKKILSMKERDKKNNVLQIKKPEIEQLAPNLQSSASFKLSVLQISKSNEFCINKKEADSFSDDDFLFETLNNHREEFNRKNQNKNQIGELVFEYDEKFLTLLDEEIEPTDRIDTIRREIDDLLN